MEYITVVPGEVVPCLWQGRGSHSAVISCDWDDVRGVVPTGVEHNEVGSGDWELEYVNYNNSVIRCL